MTTFIVGGFVTIVDIVRIVYLQDALQEELRADPSGSVSASHRSTNFASHSSFSLMWSAVEVSVRLICACGLVLKPLVLRVFPSLLQDVPNTSIDPISSKPNHWEWSQPSL